MMRRTRREPPTPVLSTDVLEWLLLGWGRCGHVHHVRAMGILRGPIADLWRANQAAIGAEARRRGLTNIWAETLFDFNPPPWLREQSQR